MKRILFSFIVFVFVAFLQTSFFAHFPIFGIVPNLLFLGFFLFLVFYRSDFASLFFPALGAGLVLDMYSSTFIGFWPALFVVFGFLVQMVKERYAFIR